MLETLLELKEYLDPETILKLAGEVALYVMILIIFAETGLMVGFFLPGDSLLFVAGLFTAIAGPGTAEPIIHHDYWTMTLSLTAAAIIGDQVGYLIGRRVGPALFKREESFFFKPKYVHQTKAFYDRHGGKTIIIGRFVPFVRTFAPVIAGVVNLEYRRFVSYNVFGGILWIFSMFSLGYSIRWFLSLEQINEYVRPNLKLLTLIIILLSLIPIGHTWWKERQAAKRKKAGGEEAQAG